MTPLSLMANAFIIAQNSKCVSWKVGAIIVRDDRIISTGYNGALAGQINCCDHSELQGWMIEHNGKLVLNPEKRKEHSEWSMVHENHAEVNAIVYAARYTGGLEGSTMYVTVSPCYQCAKQIAASGIKKLVDCDEYDQTDNKWSKVLTESGIEVYRINREMVPYIDSSVQSFQGLEKLN